MQYFMGHMFYYACYDEMLICRSFKVYDIMFHNYQHDYEVIKSSMFIWSWSMSFNQVITKVRIVSYRLFSLCRPKRIKEMVSWYAYNILALVTRTCTPSLTIGQARFMRYVHHNKDHLRWKIMLVPLALHNLCLVRKWLLFTGFTRFYFVL